MDIKNTLDVIDFGMAIGNGVAKSLKDDGKVTVGDLPNFMPAVMLLPATIEGISDIPAELKELNESELGQIRDHIVTQLPEVGEKWLVVATESFSIAVSVYKIYNAVKVA